MKLRQSLWLYLSILIALILDSYDFNSSFHEIKPNLTLLVLIYWNIAIPDKIGIYAPLAFGALYDLLEGTVLGLYALIFVSTAYLCQRFFYQFRVMRIWQQSLFIFLLTFFIKLILSLEFYQIQDFEVSLSDEDYMFNALVFSFLSSILWPLVLFSLRKYRRRFVS